MARLRCAVGADSVVPARGALRLVDAASNPFRAAKSSVMTDVAGAVEERATVGDTATTSAAILDPSQYATWIQSIQQPNGAITLHTNGERIEPYVGNWAAWGLARSDDPAALDAAWEWLEWFRDHQYPDGAVHEHELVDGAWVDTGTYDSLDGTTGLYLLALRDLHEASGDQSRIADFVASIEVSIDALASLQQDDGLLWAKPDWTVKLLMGQAEAYAGLEAGIDLAQDLRLNRSRRVARSTRAAIVRGIDALWNPSTGSFDWALHQDGAREANDWQVLYPDAASQAWAVNFGLTDASTSAGLMNSFAAAQPTWDEPTSQSFFYDGEVFLDTTGYWPIIASAFVVVGDEARAIDAAASIDAAATEATFAWPFHTGTAGQLLLLDADLSTN